MSRTTDPITLLSYADLLLWIVDILRPTSRGENEATSPEVLDQLVQQCLTDTDWTGSRLHRIERSLASLTTDVMAKEHARLFEGAVACPINETAYIRRDKGVIIADLMGFYQAFGFTVSRLSGEKPDHLIAEIEFLSVLLVMLARADMDRNAERTAVTEKALTDFCQGHLGEWIAMFCDRVLVTASIPALAECADLLRDSWDALRSSFGLECPEPNLFGTEKDDATTPYECGMCPENIIKPKTSSST